MRVVIGDHARQRFRMRGGTGKLSTARVERSLKHTLRLGAAYTERGRADTDRRSPGCGVCTAIRGGRGRVAVCDDSAAGGAEETFVKG